MTLLINELKTSLKNSGYRLAVQESLIDLLESEAARTEQLRGEAFQIAQHIKPDDVLSRTRLQQSVECIFQPPRWGNDAPVKVKVELSDGHYGPYFNREISPDLHAAVFTYAERELLSEDRSNMGESIKVSVPKRYEQVRSTIELKCRLHRLRYLARELVQFEQRGKTSSSKPEKPLPHEHLRKQVELRYKYVSSILDTTPEQSKELERALRPLPYFFEAPLLAWERSGEKIRLHSANACLEQLLKISCLLALEELHQCGGVIQDLIYPDCELLQKIQGHPSLGDWSRLLDEVAKNRKHFKVWGEWVDTLVQGRMAIIEAITARNRISHPDHTIDIEFVDETEAVYQKLFDAMFPKLRTACGQSRVVTSKSRKVLADERGKPYTVVTCDDLTGAYEPFREVDLALPSDSAAKIIDGVPFSHRDGSILPMNRYFKISTIPKVGREMFIYDREYDAGKGIVVGIISGFGQCVDLSQDLFDFSSGK